MAKKSSLYFLPTLIVVLAVLVGLYCELKPRVEIPAHLSNHAALSETDLVPEALARDLQRVIVQMGEFPSNVHSSRGTGFSPTHAHIGEAAPLSAEGDCEHALLSPDPQRTACILPDRVDVGKHYVLTGGLDGKKESVQDSIDRVSSFARYVFVDDNDDGSQLQSNPAVRALFESEAFQSAARRVCPAHKQVVDAFQFNFIVQVPGQTVALHLDAPYFWGATRFEFPQWLLATMAYSGLFQDRFVDQVQAVAYLHDWHAHREGEGEEGGEFVYFPNSTHMLSVPPLFRSGTFVDGSKVVHAAKIYRPRSKAPHMPLDEDCALRHVPAVPADTHTSSETNIDPHSGRWQVQCRSTDPLTGEVSTHVNGDYSWHDLRISIVYRARCFETESERVQFRAAHHRGCNGGGERALSLEEILGVFKDDLVRTKKTSLSRDALDKMAPLDLAFFLMNAYAKYPLPPKELAYIPYNYCAASLVFPSLKPLLDIFCE